MKKNASTEKEIKQYLGPDVYKMLVWVLCCERPVLLKLPDEKQIKEMECDNQYMMLVDDPAKAAQFGAWRKQYGSYFAFHVLKHTLTIIRVLALKIGTLFYEEDLSLLLVLSSKPLVLLVSYFYYITLLDGTGIYFAEDANTSFG